MKTFTFLSLILWSFVMSGQLVNKGNLKIETGTTLYVAGIDVINDNGTSYTWSNNGTFIMKGDNFINNGTMDSAATGRSGFSGNNEQHIQGTAVAYFNNLNINNANNSVIQDFLVEAQKMKIADGSVDFDYKVSDGQVLTVHNAITLDGDLRLIDTAQLVQTHTGTTTNSGANYIWIDQQGTTNQYYYNYWAAPVNRDGVWRMSYLKDGATGDNVAKSSYPDINIVSNYASTSDLPAQTSHPVSLNAYWVYAFKNGLDGSYQGWYDNHLQQNGTTLPGEGYTMKGPGVDAALNAANGTETTEYKSWTFSGSPNDGDYSVTISPDHDYLIGNPYPSALDADQFILDNISVDNGGNNSNDIFNGNLYFWEHTGGNDHFGANYEGGYAVYNLTGGTPATDWQTGTTTVGTKTPQRYVPVAQGFFVWSESTNDGGSIIFNNAQRKFVTEGSNSVFIRPAALTNIRLGFTTPENYHRQLLLGVRPQTTEGIDIGWDAPNFDTDYPGADMTWNINEKSYLIQAIPELTEDTHLPLKVVIDTDDSVSFSLDAVENLPAGVSDIYIYDQFDDSYHLINADTNFTIFLNAGNYDGRFELVFKKAALNNEQIKLNNVSAYYNTLESAIVILNAQQQNIEKINLYNLTGQIILSEKLMRNDAKITIPVRLTTGIYLAKILSQDQKVFTTKLLIK